MSDDRQKLCPNCRGSTRCSFCDGHVCQNCVEGKCVGCGGVGLVPNAPQMTPVDRMASAAAGWGVVEWVEVHGVDLAESLRRSKAPLPHLEET